MARRKRQIELFEVLAERKIKRPSSIQPSDAQDTPPAMDTRMLARSDRDIVFGVDVAFVIFAVILVFIGSAYFLGYQRGQIEARRETFTRMDKPGSLFPSPATLEVEEKLEGSLSPTERSLPGSHFTLRLRSTRRHDQAELERLRQDLRFVLADAFIAEHGLDAYIFDNGSVYSLGLGVFDARGARLLAQAKERFVNSSGPASSTENTPYKTASAERIEDLGKVLP